MSSRKTSESNNSAASASALPKPPQVKFVPLWAWGLFLLMAVIRGTTPLMLQLAEKVITPPLVFSIRAPVSACLFAITLFFKCLASNEFRAQLKADFVNPYVQKTMIFMGVFQSAVPFLAIGWAVERISSASAGVMYALVPLLASGVVLFPCFRNASSKMDRFQIIGLVVGLTGVVMILAQQLGSPHVGTTAEIVSGFLVCFFGVFMWAIASVFWAQRKLKIHWALAGMLTNLYGSVVMVSTWIVYHYACGIGQNDEYFDGTDAIFFLAMTWMAAMSGYMANTLLYILFDVMGSIRTNEVLYLVPVAALFDEVVFLKAWSGVAAGWIVLQLIGTGVVLSGLKISSISAKRAAERQLLEANQIALGSITHDRTESESSYRALTDEPDENGPFQTEDTYRDRTASFHVDIGGETFDEDETKSLLR